MLLIFEFYNFWSINMRGDLTRIARGDPGENDVLTNKIVSLKNKSCAYQYQPSHSCVAISDVLFLRFLQLAGETANARSKVNFSNQVK